MRAMFSAFCVAGVLATVVSGTPLSRDKRFAGVFTSAGFPFGAGGMAYAGPRVGSFGGLRNTNPTGAQFFNPFDIFGQDGFFNVMPMPFVVPVPMPTFPVFKNWYEGENVCKEEKIMNTQMPDDVVPDEWKDDMPNINTDFSHEQETCKGTDKKYVCVKRVVGNGGEAQIKATKYECCHGFVRDPSGNPGCVESQNQTPNGAGQNTNGKLTPNDPTYYLYTGNNMRGSSSISSSSSSRSSTGNVDKVPLQ